MARWVNEIMSHFQTAADLSAGAPKAVVCVPTFRRPAMLAGTLRSLAEQRSSVRFAVIVTDNDAADRNGISVAQPFFDRGALRGHVVVEPQQGNVHAINRAFSTALERYPQAKYFLMIDDDEIAVPNWLEAMVAAAHGTGCDIVGGPVLPVFEDGQERRHPVFWPAYRASGAVPMIYGSGNCLITRRAFDRLGALFDPRFNFLGGGDTEFFTRAKDAGLRSFWAQEAIVHELVGQDRTTAQWIVKRGLRIGAINYRIDCLRAGRAAPAGVLAKNAAVSLFAVYRSLRLAIRHASMLEAMHPLVIACGRWLAALGIHPEQYRAKTCASP
jgi:GT2 family glycosyltransferase